jgi:hypothetical protein
MSETLQGVIIGGVLAGVVAVVTQVLAARNRANAAREASRHEELVWHRNQRLEAHHAFLNQVNRLVHVIGAIDRAGPGTPEANAKFADLEETLARTVDAFNRVELVCSPQMYDLAVKILSAANAQQLTSRANFPAVMRAIGEASRNYRDAARAELGTQGVT